jgi:histidinol-phosphate aminotransferase
VSTRQCKLVERSIIGPALLQRTADTQSAGYRLALVELARSLKQIGIGAFHELNRLALVAAQASLADHAHVAAVRATVADERERWHDLLRARSISFSDAQASFVFFDAGSRHGDVIATLAAQGIRIKQPCLALLTWLRISIGLPDENALVREIVTNSLR